MKKILINIALIVATNFLLIAFKVFFASLFGFLFGHNIVDFVQYLALTYTLSYKTVIFEISTSIMSIVLTTLVLKTIFKETNQFNSFLIYYGFTFILSFTFDALLLIPIKAPQSNFPLVVLILIKSSIIFYLIFRYTTALNKLNSIHHKSLFGKKNIFDNFFFQIFAVAIINSILLPALIYKTEIWALFIFFPTFIYLLVQFFKKIMRVKLWYDLNYAKT